MSTVPATPFDAFRQIRASLKILAVMEAQGICDRQAVADADAEVEAALQVIERQLRPPSTTLPIMTLGNIVCEAKRRRPNLQVVS